MNAYLRYRRFTLGDFLTECYLVFRDREALLIDSPVPAPDIDNFLVENGLNLIFIVNTHGHIDHIGGNRYFKEQYPGAKLLIHEREVRYLLDPSLNLSSKIYHPFVSPESDQALAGEAGRFLFGGVPVDYLHTPGHTPGSMCLYFPDLLWLFSGDTLFAGSVGRTDLPGGSFQALTASLKKMCSHFPGEATVLPGHGPMSTLQEEISSNPYLIELVGKKV
ncbi:MAG TPA: MBL fold metallo-hydrolase [Atribacteraceae bacterium]|nr:MBL fold metallo-hydrolase [Atribacteraceae bacterium]